MTYGVLSEPGGRPRVRPVELMAMMRHESYETTLTYYAQQTAEDVAEAAWKAFGEGLGEQHQTDTEHASADEDASSIVKDP